MPVGKLKPIIDFHIEGPQDVEKLFDAFNELSDRGFFTHDTVVREIADQIIWLLAVHPDWIAPVRDALVTEHTDDLGFSFDWMVRLMETPSDRLIDILIDRYRQTPDARMVEWALAASGTETALLEVAKTARSQSKVDRLNELGFEVPPTGPAVPRFIGVFRPLRFQAVRTADEAEASDHPVGLPVDLVVTEDDERVAWHYCSLSIRALGDMPDWPAHRAHLVSPRLLTGWTLWAKPDDAGRLRTTAVLEDDPMGDWQFPQGNPIGGPPTTPTTPSVRSVCEF